MGHHLNMITLGVRDKRASREFYEALGWTGGAGGEGHDPVFYNSHGMVVALWERGSLAEDSLVAHDAGGWGGITLAHNVGSREEVDAAVERVRAAGGEIRREPGEVFWGGYTAIVADLDGHPWEIAHNPYWTVTDDGDLAMG